MHFHVSSGLCPLRISATRVVALVVCVSAYDLTVQAVGGCGCARATAAKLVVPVLRLALGQLRCWSARGTHLCISSACGKRATSLSSGEAGALLVQYFSSVTEAAQAYLKIFGH